MRSAPMRVILSPFVLSPFSFHIALAPVPCALLLALCALLPQLTAHGSLLRYAPCSLLSAHCLE